MKSRQNFSLSGNIVDLIANSIFKGTVYIEDGIIRKIVKQEVKEDHYILPGLIDSHIHIESSMLIPSEFAKLAVVHGTVATVSDPHEIANVLGIDGIKYMISNGNKVPFKFYFGASACVPATPFETSGFQFHEAEMEELLGMKEIKYLSEMMNFPGVINRDPWEMKKIEIARNHNKPIDGHAPGITSDDARKYAEAGITTDHECFSMKEALDKIEYGMKIQIREGSAAKNFDALIDLMQDHEDQVLFCSDDKHPNDLVKGHINELVVRAIKNGYEPLKVLRSAIINPIEHYNLDVGVLQVGDPADMIVIDSLEEFKILQTYVNGMLVAENGTSYIESAQEAQPNNFHAKPISVNKLKVSPTGDKLKVIEAYDGQLVTGSLHENYKVEGNNVVSDVKNDILKIVVLNRYEVADPAIGFIKNFNLKNGAIASSVAHDSHNIVAVGTTDKDIAKAINLVIAESGGISLVNETEDMILPLPVAGLMSTSDGYKVAKSYQKMDDEVHKMGSKLRAPFMTLSFMALLVIPKLKLSDKGLFDGDTFSFTNIFE
ncbi:MAG: adenine deaminase [Bacteroidetes bacterium]|jgi:adenine deaminase|nr:adenine deaminase [Bacteroidota bacterium]|tara:strand:+ start:2068 stop:3705 length:1638 start_codon:yes stop_codon:yes gene_type:complete